MIINRGFCTGIDDNNNYNEQTGKQNADKEYCHFICGLLLLIVCLIIDVYPY